MGETVAKMIPAKKELTEMIEVAMALGSASSKSDPIHLMGALKETHQEQ
jgi:hypothetical protein